MADRNITCTLISRHDSETNWVLAKDFIPRQGEIVIYDADQLHNYERIKVGDGKTVVGDLPFVNSGLEIVDYNEDLQEGIFSIDADFLGGISSENYALKSQIVTSVNGQIGDIFIEGPDLSSFYSQENPPPYPVTSINGETGDIILVKEDSISIPGAEEDLEEGIYLVNAEQLGGRNAAAYALKEEVVTSINGKKGDVILEERDLSSFYSSENPPPYPVISINGQSGEVILEDNLTIVDTEEDLEEGIYVINADQLGGRNATEYVLKEQSE